MGIEILEYARPNGETEEVKVMVPDIGDRWHRGRILATLGSEILRRCVSLVSCGYLEIEPTRDRGVVVMTEIAIPEELKKKYFRSDGTKRLPLCRFSYGYHSFGVNLTHASCDDTYMTNERYTLSLITLNEFSYLKPISYVDSTILLNTLTEIVVYAYEHGLNPDDREYDEIIATMQRQASL